MKHSIFVAVRPSWPRRVFRFPAGITPRFADGLAIDGVPVSACIGPFRTVRGAAFCANCGEGNPHCQHVNDAERLGQQYDSKPLLPVLTLNPA